MKSGYDAPAIFDRPIQIRFPSELIERIDAWGKAERMRSRSEAIRQLLEDALSKKEKGEAPAS